jgi:hypothetical protein
MPVALPIDTQLMNVPSPPAMVRFWTPSGSTTVAGVTTLPKLSLVPQPELYMEQLQVSPPTQGGVRAQVRLGAPLQFQAGSGDFILDHDEE